MKKLFSAVLAIAMVLSIAPVALAATLSEGHVYLKDDDYYDDDQNGTVAPGTTCYVYLRDYDKDAEDNNEPKKIKIDDVEVTDSDTGKTVKLLSVQRSASRLKISSDDRAWFAKVTVKSVSSSSYPDDGYDVDEFSLEYTFDGKEETLEVDLSNIEYEESDGELEEDEKLFKYDKEDDIDIDLPDDAGRFTGTARKDFEVIASMNTDVSNAMLNKYPNADIRFFNGNGATFPVTSGKMYIEADSDDYLYEVSSKNTLTDRSSTWKSSENAFVINTTKIGKYIVSDTKLSDSRKSTEPPASSVPAASSVAPSASSQSDYIGSTPITNPVALYNPSTGACA